MDSFVLAETFKYLYLLFSEKEDIILDLDDFIFTTEAHLLPLTLSVGNYSWKTPPKVHPDIYKFDMMSVAEMTKAVNEEANLDSPGGSDIDEDRGICHNYHVTNTEGSGYPHKLRHQLRDLVDRMHPRVQTELPRLKAADFVAGNKEHLDMLRDMGIRIATMPDGRIQLLHTSSEAASPAHADAGLQFMQEMIELSKMQKQESQHDPMFVRLLSEPFNGEVVYKAGPSQFGYNLSNNPPVQGQLAVAKPFKACGDVENGDEIAGKIAIIERGDCMFVDKARNLQNRGAIGGIVLDQAQGSSSELLSLFAMSGDGTNDITIPMVFLFWKQGHDLFETLHKYPRVLVELTSKEGAPKPQVPTPVVTSDPTSATTPLVYPAASEHSDTRILEAPSTAESDPPSVPTLGEITKAEHAFYHHELLDASTRQYFLQAGTRFLHLSVEVSPREEGDSEQDCRRMKYEPLPNGSKMFTFYLRHRLSGMQKPNLNEMYLDVIHSLQHYTNFEQLDQSSEYMKAIARFMESAFFSIERIDDTSLMAMHNFAFVIKTKHTFPRGETTYVGENKHAAVNSDMTPPPVINAHIVDVLNSGSSSSIAPDASADIQVAVEGSSVTTETPHQSEAHEHSRSTHEQLIQPSQRVDFSDSSATHSSSLDSASLHLPELTSTESNIQSSLIESDVYSDSSVRESDVHHDSRQQYEDSSSLKSQSVGSIQQPHVDPQSEFSSAATHVVSSSTTAHVDEHPEKEKDAHKIKDEF